MFEPINLDALTIDPAELERVSCVLRELSIYADWKARAMRYRRKGNVASALSCERTADSVYRQLPEWARW